MARKRFRWTRALYKRADSLCRFMNRNLYELPANPPRLVQRYFDLWERYPQRDDPLLVPLRYRQNHWDDGLPF